MFPQAVPRLVFGLALLWAWLNIPIGIYGTLWLLALAYFTVMLPLGVRTLAGVVLQIDKSLEECARVCGASWAYQMRTVTLPPSVCMTWAFVPVFSIMTSPAGMTVAGMARVRVYSEDMKLKGLAHVDLQRQASVNTA